MKTSCSQSRQGKWKQLGSATGPRSKTDPTKCTLNHRSKTRSMFWSSSHSLLSWMSWGVCGLIFCVEEASPNSEVEVICRKSGWRSQRIEKLLDATQVFTSCDFYHSGGLLLALTQQGAQNSAPHNNKFWFFKNIEQKWKLQWNLSKGTLNVYLQGLCLLHFSLKINKICNLTRGCPNLCIQLHLNGMQPILYYCYELHLHMCLCAAELPVWNMKSVFC